MTARFLDCPAHTDYGTSQSTKKDLHAVYFFAQPSKYKGSNEVMRMSQNGKTFVLAGSKSNITLVRKVNIEKHQQNSIIAHVFKKIIEISNEWANQLSKLLVRLNYSNQNNFNHLFFTLSISKLIILCLILLNK